MELAECKEFRQGIENRIEKVENAINGNGAIGLKAQVNANTTFRVRFERIFDKLTFWLIIQSILLVATMGYLFLSQ